jgi:hypothetical protein
MKFEGCLQLHDLGARAKTHLLEAGMDEVLRDKMAGHTLQGMDRYYLRLTDEHLRRAMDLYTEWLDGQIAEVPQNVPQTHLTP